MSKQVSHQPAPGEVEKLPCYYLFGIRLEGDVNLHEAKMMNVGSRHTMTSEKHKRAEIRKARVAMGVTMTDGRVVAKRIL